MHAGRPSTLWAFAFDACDPAARAALLTAHSNVFGGAPDVRWLDWKFGEGGGVGCGLWSAPTTADGTLAAFCGGVPRTLHHAGRTVSALQIGDVMVQPAWRSAARRGGAFYQVSDALYRAQLGATGTHEWGFGFPSHRHLRLAVKLGLLHDAGPMIGAVWSTETHRSLWDWAYCVEPLGRFEDPNTQAVISGCWSRMRRSAGAWALGERSSTWVRWRYHFQSVDVAPAALWQVRRRWSRAADGIVALRPLTASGQSAAMWLDWIGPPAQLPLGLAAAQRCAARMQRSELHAWLSAGPWETLRHKAPLAHHEVARIGIPAACALTAQDAAATPWWFMSGDTDFL